MVELTAGEVLGLRLSNLLLTRRERRDPGEVVEWMGAMQAQDLASGEWSFGVRCAGLTQQDIHQATVDRKILRTWPMRGTVHFVAPRDARWMLDVTGVRALDGAQRRREHLGLTLETVDRAAEVLAEALRGGGRLTRGECVELLVDAGLHAASQHGYHLLRYASQIGVTCIGPQRGSEQTFVLLDEWVPDPRVLSRDEALAELALRYFRSHGPATRQDFAGWTGLGAADARSAIAGAGESLVSVSVDGSAMHLHAGVADGGSGPSDPDRTVLLLPGFDEYMLGYKDRSAMASAEQMKRVLPGSNGVFKPTVVADGVVIGTWSRKAKRNHVDIVVEPFGAVRAARRRAIDAAAHEYAAYLGTEPKLSFAQ